MSVEAAGEPRPSRSRVDFVWPVAEAKAKFSEVIELAREDGPQTIARRGKPVAVVVSIDEWNRKNKRKGTLVEFLQTAPMDLSELETPNMDWTPRSLDLG